MCSIFKYRLAFSLALLLLFSGTKASYAYANEKAHFRTECIQQAKGEHHLNDEQHAPVAILLQAFVEATNRVWQSDSNGGSGGFSGKFPEVKNIRFQDKADVEFNFIRWHVLQQLIQQSQLRGRYPTHGFW
ncbi:MAG: hypothetical protein ABI378_01440 [Chitinophagaceae bacterium]